MKKSYLEYCKEFAISELELIDTQVYGCDLANLLTQEININGTATFSRYQAQEYIKEWWNEAGEIYEYLENNYGQVYNPFSEAEAFHVCMIIEGVNNILSKCPEVNKFWDESKILTKQLVEKIIKEIEQVVEIDF